MHEGKGFLLFTIVLSNSFGVIFNLVLPYSSLDVPFVKRVDLKCLRQTEMEFIPPTWTPFLLCVTLNSLLNSNLCPTNVAILKQQFGRARHWVDRSVPHGKTGFSAFIDSSEEFTQLLSFSV